MRIVAVTMHGPDTAKLWVDAYASVVGLVDGFMGYHPEQVTDFAAERNIMLEMASDDNYDWALMLDTDERMVPNGREWQEIRAILEVETDPPADVFMVRHIGGTYAKERLFRLPASGHYHGRTHEAFILDPGAVRRTLHGIAFDEVPKTPEQYRAKVERDRPLLEAMTEEEPTDPRWWYYLGDTYLGLGFPPDNAIACFQRCWSLKGWDEEAAWSCYRIAEIQASQEIYEDAIYWCVRGMETHPGMSELPWLAGWCCYQMGQYRKATWWEEMAKALNNVSAVSERIGFRYPPALYEGPFDVLRFAYQALGDEPGVTYAEERFQEMLRLRTLMEKNPGS